jgi:hypothetical protein
MEYEGRLKTVSCVPGKPVKYKTHRKEVKYGNYEYDV